MSHVTISVRCSLGDVDITMEFLELFNDNGSYNAHIVGLVLEQTMKRVQNALADQASADD